MLEGDIRHESRSPEKATNVLNVRVGDDQGPCFFMLVYQRNVPRRKGHVASVFADVFFSRRMLTSVVPYDFIVFRLC